MSSDLEEIDGTSSQEHFKTVKNLEKDYLNKGLVDSDDDNAHT